MITSLLTKVFGSKNDRELKKLQPTIENINTFEPEIQALSDEQLKAQAVLFRQRLEKGESLDDILPEAFATVREASVRTLKMRHFDAQLIGGIVLHQGKIAEMKTGEGKTLAATLPAYLNALFGKGVHIITVNDYLARRDTEWMGNIYNFLGLSVGSILHGLDDEERKAAYGADITYGTNNEFGFDYLRDNMKFDLESVVQGELNFAIVDEVDLDKNGNFIRGKIYSFKQIYPGYPVPDKNNRASILIRSLSQTDFPENKIRIDDRGNITK